MKAVPARSASERECEFTFPRGRPFPRSRPGGTRWRFVLVRVLVGVHVWSSLVKTCLARHIHCMSEPIAYFLTWTSYGTWLSGDPRGWVRFGGGGVQDS